MLQINTSGEASKFGFAEEDFLEVFPKLYQLKHLKIQGLMTIATHDINPEVVRKDFKMLRELLEKTQEVYNDPDYQELSMGMSQDWPQAIEEGATMLRIGSRVFGERK